MAEMTLGQLRDRVSLQSPTNTPTKVGPASVTYATVATVAAAVRSFRDYEVARFRQMESKAEREVVIRVRTDVTTAWRVMIGGVAYAIESVEPDRRWAKLKVYKAGT